MAFFKFRQRGQPQPEAAGRARGKEPVAPGPQETIDTLRRRARHRLVGAAVLVGAAIIGFPLLFDTQPRPVAVNAPITIPDKDKVPRLAIPEPVSATASLGEREEVVPSTPRRGERTGAQPAASAAARSPAPAEPRSADKPAAARDTRRDTPADARAKADETAAKAKAEEAARAKAEQAARAKREEDAATAAQRDEERAKAQARRDEEARTRADAQPKRDDEARTQRDAENRAKREQEARAKRDAELRAKREEAARARALLEGRANAKPAAAAPEASSRFIVQVGAFSEDAAAREARQKAERAGVKTYTQVVNTSAGPRTRVRVGPFASREEAEKAAAALKKAGLAGSILAL